MYQSKKFTIFDTVLARGENYEISSTLNRQQFQRTQNLIKKKKEKHEDHDKYPISSRKCVFSIVMNKWAN